MCSFITGMPFISKLYLIDILRISSTGFCILIKNLWVLQSFTTYGVTISSGFLVIIIVQQSITDKFVAIYINQVALLSSTNCLWMADVTYFYILDVVLSLLMIPLSTNLRKHLRGISSPTYDNIRLRTICCWKK